VRLRQPATGARVGIDPLFLAAAVPAEPGQQVLDIGCGSGAASLCLAARVPGCRITGLELQRDLVRLAGENAALNGMSDRVTVIAANLLRPPPRLSPGTFDHVMANPPFIEAGRGTAARDRAKAAASMEGEASLADWVRFALVMARDKGSLTFIHRADRIDALLGQIAGRAGEVVMFPLWPGAGRPASRILLRARKQIRAPARLSPGLVLHEPDGRFTREADAILRAGEPLAL
jgi:tRNA1(Val) A37 N6-methylase TrmN6